MKNNYSSRIILVVIIAVFFAIILEGGYYNFWKVLVASFIIALSGMLAERSVQKDEREQELEEELKKIEDKYFKADKQKKK